MRSGAVILGEKPRRIYVPPGCEDRDLVGRCLVPGCGAVFYAGQEELWQRHVGDCARRNMDRLREASRRRVPAIIAEDFDPEVSAHMRRLGRRMLAEGRLEVKPSERAGFS